ncbi:hypothetical protein LG293_09880 [Citricoccus nitrophenolicus]
MTGRPIYLHAGQPPHIGYPVGPSFFRALDEAFREIGRVFRDTIRQVWKAASSAYRLIPDETREQAAIDAGRRYWTDQRGRTRRTTGARPPLHNGRKPRP